MQLAILCNKEMQYEVTAQGTIEGTELLYLDTPLKILNYPTVDAIIDVDFEWEKQRIDLLKSFGKPVIVHSVTHTLNEIDASFVRINAWPGFLKSSMIEASCLNEEGKKAANIIFRQLGKEIEWLPDEPGFVSPRVISMIINEAYFALAEGVSTKEEIDTAMKLGTAYPYGPFEWAQKIGLDKIAGLLTKLSVTFPRYAPAELLLTEAAQPNI